MLTACFRNTYYNSKTRSKALWHNRKSTHSALVFNLIERGTSMKKSRKYWLIVFLCLFSFCLISCGDKSTPSAISNSDKLDEQAILKETQAFIDQFSKDLSAGKTEAVINHLDSSTRLQIENSLDLSSPEAKKLAEAISSAKSTQVNATIVFYETTADGETLSFYILKEAGQWKLGGL
jgi:hypothetical protein